MLPWKCQSGNIMKLCADCNNCTKFQFYTKKSSIFCDVTLFCVHNVTSLVIAFSRNERTHPNLVSQAREIEIFWTANWPPL